jgi:DNA modification methylase
MAGTGTTGYTAKMLERDFVMIEKKKEYVEVIVRRLINA